MSVFLPPTLPGALPLAPIAQPQALFPAVPGTPAPGMPAAGFLLALQQTARPAPGDPVPLEASAGTSAPAPTSVLAPALPDGAAEGPASDTQAGPSDDDTPAGGDLQAPALLAPLFVPVAATPAFQPHGLALLNTATLSVASTTSAALSDLPNPLGAAGTAPVPAAPSAAVPTGEALVPAAAATVQAALPSLAAAIQQAALPPSQAPAAVAAQPQAMAQQAPVLLQAQAQAQIPAAAPAEAQAAPLEKVLAAGNSTVARDAAVVWNPAAADGLPAAAPLSSAAPAAPKDGTQAATDLAQALGDRIDWQIRRGNERAQIRLDPPMQGQLEITVRRDGAGLQIHLSATHSDVVRQLHAISDSLRGDLSMRQTGDVTVTIAQHAPREQDGRGRQAQDHTPESQDPGRALAEAEHEQAPQAFALTHS